MEGKGHYIEKSVPGIKNVQVDQTRLLLIKEGGLQTLRKQDLHQRYQSKMLENVPNISTSMLYQRTLLSSSWIFSREIQLEPHRISILKFEDLRNLVNSKLRCPPWQWMPVKPASWPNSHCGARAVP